MIDWRCPMSVQEGCVWFSYYTITSEISFKDIQIDRGKNLHGTALRVKIYCCSMKRIR